MPVFKDFAENGDLLQTRVEELNEKNFIRYLKEHGSEKAQGYLEAMQDMTNQINNILYKPKGDYEVPGTLHSVMRETKQLYLGNLEFLKFAAEQIKIHFPEKLLNPNSHP